MSQQHSSSAPGPGLDLSWFPVHFQDHIASQEEREERGKNSKEGMEFKKSSKYKGNGLA